VRDLTFIGLIGFTGHSLQDNEKSLAIYSKAFWAKTRFHMLYVVKSSKNFSYSVHPKNSYTAKAHLPCHKCYNTNDGQ
jgi:hypothetical protein